MNIGPCIKSQNLVNLVVSKYLDKLIEAYNQKTRIPNGYKLSIAERVYSQKGKEEESEGDIRKELEKQIEEFENKLENEFKNIEKKLAEAAEKQVKVLEKTENAYRMALRLRYMSRNGIVSPRTYRKIMSYYMRHKKQKYYSRYKIDKELHNFIMRLGRYLESLDKSVVRWDVRDFSADYHYYALQSVVMFSVIGIKGVLASLAAALIEISHVAEVVLHVALKLFPQLLNSVPILSSFASIMPHLLAATVVAILAGSMLMIIGYSIHPERKYLFKRMIDKVKINLGIRRSYMHAIYTIYIYKLYDLLSALASYVIKVSKLISKGKDIKEEETAKKLLEVAQKSTGIVSLTDKILAFIGDKSNSERFEGVKQKIEDLKETIMIDLDNYKKLIASIKEDNKELNVLGFKFQVSDEGMKELRKYYGDKFSSEGEWIEVTVKYKGYAEAKSANPLQEVNISGFSGKSNEEIANFIGAVLAIADKLVVDRIGEQEFESPLVMINLQKLKWLSYKNGPFIDKVKEIISWLRNKKKVELSPDNIGNKMFEAYISVNAIKSIETEKGEKQTAKGEVVEETAEEETAEKE
jgi:hypothetical protein